MAAQAVGRRAGLVLSSVTTAHLAPAHLAATHAMPTVYRQSVSLSSVAQLRGLRFARENNEHACRAPTVSHSQPCCSSHNINACRRHLPAINRPVMSRCMLILMCHAAGSSQQAPSIRGLTTASLVRQRKSNHYSNCSASPLDEGGVTHASFHDFMLIGQPNMRRHDICRWIRFGRRIRRTRSSCTRSHGEPHDTVQTAESVNARSGVHEAGICCCAGAPTVPR
jgi:hypothetical protein